MMVMSGKASGRCRGVEGVPGWFTPNFTGYVAACSWRDGQTGHEPEVRSRWAIIERVDRVWGVARLWCLPPGMAELAAADPTWTPDVPFDLLPPQARWEILDQAAAAGRPRPGREPLVPRSPTIPAASPAAAPKRRGRKQPQPAAGS